MRKITAIVIHCSATPNGDDRFGVETLQAMHLKRGFRKIGYHFVITVDGLITEGRAVEEIGAHVAGSNANSIGICMVGTDKFSIRQWDALQVLVEEMRNRFPEAKVLGHRDYSPDRNGDGVIDHWEWFKTCPGFDVAEWMLAGRDPLWNPLHILEKGVRV